MGLKPAWTEKWKQGLASAACVGLLGLLIWYPHEKELSLAENGWSRLSYDLAYLFRPDVRVDDLVIVAMDERSFREFGFGMDQLWPRSLHAQLLDKLTADDARLVVFDVWFGDPGTEEQNKPFREAMQRNGRVVLAAVLADMNTPGLAGQFTMPPRREFATNAAAWGISELYKDADGVSRQIYPGTEAEPSLGWAAVGLLRSASDPSAGHRFDKRWLNYYGQARHLPFVSYAEAIHKPDGYFANKIVVIGAQNQTLRVGEENDEFPVPHTRWRQTYASGAEIMATSILNLARSDWLARLPAGLEAALILAAGLVLGFALSRWQPLPALGVAMLAAALGCFASILFIWKSHLWFSWMIILGVQAPAAWLGSVLIHFTRVRGETHFLRRTLDETISEIKRPSSLTPLTAPEGGPPRIPDHELLRRVGRGAYGEVWLARNTIGMFHAVKIVHRDSFSHEGPYEREFRGIQKYMPVSRSHPGLVNILHVGRNDAAGYFFYIMEAADDEVTGTTIVPDTYRPRNLATVLGKNRVLSPPNCVTLLAALANALETLHREKLVHRDIKPSNIIYLNGVPKFADIGLVTDLASRQNQVTMVGTRGYMPPEGPGTATADVFSLGKVLYQASTGMDPDMFPELPSDFMDRSDFSDFKELNVIMGRACDSEPGRRYQTAGEMHADLLRLQFKWQSRDTSKV